MSTRKSSVALVDRAAFDAALGKLLKTKPLPLSEIPKKRKPARKAKKPTR